MTLTTKSAQPKMTAREEEISIIPNGIAPLLPKCRFETIYKKPPTVSKVIAIMPLIIRPSGARPRSPVRAEIAVPQLVLFTMNANAVLGAASRLRFAIRTITNVENLAPPGPNRMLLL
jgi:hypothetical protein